MRDRLRPLELLGFSGAIALFTGIVILFSTRNWTIALIGLGVAFIAAILVIALLALSEKPNSSKDQVLRDDDDQPPHE
nr:MULTISPECIES: ABC transporter ATP-binding protein [unclassified Cryobacterium]